MAPQESLNRNAALGLAERARRKAARTRALGGESWNAPETGRNSQAFLRSSNVFGSNTLARMRTGKRFSQLDVFSNHALLGNPLAVVHDAHDLDLDTMRALARWTNLSETTFLLPPSTPSADYRVRIFTPNAELPFAGHPTLGTCHAWLMAGGQPRRPEIVQECGIGLVSLRRLPQLAFQAPPLKAPRPLEPEVLQQVVHALRVPFADVVAHQWLDNGSPWCGLVLRSASEVLALKPDFALMRGLKVGVLGPHPPGLPFQFEVRAFVPDLGIPEDPVTGSLNAGFGVWLTSAGLSPPRYVVRQGTSLLRDGRVFVTQEANAVWVGGDVTSVVEGTLRLEPSLRIHEHSAS
jgi:PhzF family phenazine biosynthesis protein